MVAVVTGAGSGIGRVTAHGLSADGYAVAVADIDLERSQAVVGEIQNAGGRAASFTVDVGDPSAVVAMASEVVHRLGRPAVLVNCAGWDEIQAFADTSPPFWDRVLAVNLRGVIATTHGFLDALVAAQGRIVNVASDAGRVGSSGETVYAAAKAGVIGFTKSIAREVAAHGVTANCVCPGPIDTPFLEKNPPRLREALTRAIPMRRVGRPEDVSHAIRFFASPEASYITGQVLSVSGGLTMNG